MNKLPYLLNIEDFLFFKL